MRIDATTDHESWSMKAAEKGFSSERARMVRSVQVLCVLAIGTATLLTGCRVVTPQPTLRQGAHWFPPTFPYLSGRYQKQLQIHDHPHIGPSSLGSPSGPGEIVVEDLFPNESATESLPESYFAPQPEPAGDHLQHPGRTPQQDEPQQDDSSGQRKGRIRALPKGKPGVFNVTEANRSLDYWATADNIGR